MQERMKDSQEQLQLLTQQMNQLMQEKAELETRNKILEQVVRLNVEHVDQLQTNKVHFSPLCLADLISAGNEN